MPSLITGMPHIFRCLRRYPESLAEIERAQALDPGSKSVLADKGIIFFNAGRQQEATPCCSRWNPTSRTLFLPIAI